MPASRSLLNEVFEVHESSMELTDFSNGSTAPVARKCLRMLEPFWVFNVNNLSIKKTLKITYRRQT